MCIFFLALAGNKKDTRKRIFLLMVSRRRECEVLKKWVDYPGVSWQVRRGNLRFLSWAIEILPGETR
jgi:hypothetical protein